MASKFCSKCGREVLAGKRFCGGCGQAMPMAVALPPDEAAAATHVCGQCGTALVPGKRFCKKCGHAVDDLATAAGSTQVSESAVVAETAPVAASVVPVCGRCGAALTPGKRFCKLCGQPAGAPAASTTFDLPGSAPVPAELPKAAIDPAPTPDHAPTITMEIAVPDPEPIAEENPQASKIEEVEEAEEAVPLPATSSAEISEAAPVAVPRDLSKAKIGLAIGFAAAGRGMYMRIGRFPPRRDRLLQPSNPLRRCQPRSKPRQRRRKRPNRPLEVLNPLLPKHRGRHPSLRSSPVRIRRQLFSRSALARPGTGTRRRPLPCFKSRRFRRRRRCCHRLGRRARVCCTIRDRQCLMAGRLPLTNCLRRGLNSPLTVRRGSCSSSPIRTEQNA